MTYKRIQYLLLSIATIFMGLSARKFATSLPDWLNIYLGDALWALMIFLFFRVVFVNKKTLFITLLSLIFCYGIEFSQIYQAAWLNNIKATRLGGLVLGFGFQWSDIIAYTLGISFAAIIEKIKYFFMEITK